MNVRLISAILMVLMSLAPVCAGSVLAGEKKTSDQSQPAKVYQILPSSREMIAVLAKQTDPVRISALIKDQGPAAYAFSAGVSREKGSVMLGVLLADLEIYVRAQDQEKVLAAATALIEGLVELGVDQALFTAVMNLRAAIHNKVPLTAINQATMPVLRPFIEAFVEEGGLLLYMRLGEWIESMYLVASIGDSAINLMKMGILADFFAKELTGEDVPQGIKEKLKILSSLAQKSSLTVRDYRTAREAALSIKTLFM
jgi:hypothetical protein